MARMVNMCCGLLNVANGGNANAGGSSYAIWSLRGTYETGEPFLMNDGVGVGFGARPYADGHDAVYFVAQENNPAEYLDQLFPARLLRYSINRDSGGPGRFRGGCGVVREIEWLGSDAILSNRLDGSAAQPWGVSGGKSGRPGKVIFNPGRTDERVLPPLGDNTKVRKGDVIRMETTGGGGWGHPFDREPARVLADVLGDFISPESARDDYGVVLAADGRTVDEPATAARRRERHPSMMFHRVEYRARMD
jgi:N-methylhydantoinase B